MGKVISIGRPVPRRCATCGGSGTVPVDPYDRRKGETTCSNCGGRGRF